VRTNSQLKGVFCLEGLLDLDLANGSTVQGILKLLQDNLDIPFFYKDFAVEGELFYYLKKWAQAKYDRWPILYLSTHGGEFEIWDSKTGHRLDEIAEHLAGKCENRMLVVSSCSTMAANKRLLKEFLKKTGFLGICGYKNDVGFLKAAAFELLLIAEMQSNEFSGRGVESIRKRSVAIAKDFKDLDFRMVTLQD